MSSLWWTPQKKIVEWDPRLFQTNLNIVLNKICFGFLQTKRTLTRNWMLFLELLALKDISCYNNFFAKKLKINSAFCNDVLGTVFKPLKALQFSKRLCNTINYSRMVSKLFSWLHYPQFLASKFSRP